MANNPFIYNPYLASLGLNPNVPPYPNPAMITPEQYRKRLMESIQPQVDQYSQYYNQAQSMGQPQPQQQPNAGSYFKVKSYEEAKSIMAPADGKPIMIIDEESGILYSKIFKDGQTFVKGFRLVEMEEREETPTPAVEPTSEDTFGKILEKLDGFDKRLSNLEGRNGDV